LISPANFSDSAFYRDEGRTLRDEYLAKGIGTYIRKGGGKSSNPYSWAKQ